MIQLETSEPWVAGQVRRRVLNVCHTWPGLTPMNLDDLEYRTWVEMAIASDRHVEEIRDRERRSKSKR